MCPYIQTTGSFILGVEEWEFEMYLFTTAEEWDRYDLGKKVERHLYRYWGGGTPEVLEYIKNSIKIESIEEIAEDAAPMDLNSFEGLTNYRVIDSTAGLGVHATGYGMWVSTNQAQRTYNSSRVLT